MTDDQLHHVKAFFLDAGLAGFGARRWMANDRLPDDVRRIFDRVLPALHDAIATHDPAWTYSAIDAEIHAGRWMGDPPAGSLSAATGTDAVRWYVELLEGGQAWMELCGAEGSDLYERLFHSSAAHGSFLDDLRAALRADDPTWRR